MARLTPRGALRRLQDVVATYGGDGAATKRECLAVLRRARLSSADQVLALHEAACFLAALPDDEQVLADARRLLDGFERRADLRAHRDELADSGVAGTDIHYPFFAPMAGWLARTHGARLHVDWETVDERARAQLLLWLEAFVLPGELFAFDETGWDARRWIERLRRPDETDAQFLVRCFDALPARRPARHRALEVLDLPYRIAGTLPRPRGRADDGPADVPPGPSRTRAHVDLGPVHFRTGPLRRGRPDLRKALATPPRSVRDVPLRQARALVDLAREAMLTRGRDLDSFAYADPRDVRLVDCGEGLQFAAMGLAMEQRNVLEAVYGFLTLQNGVPTGYVLSSALCGSSEIAYNVFDTWRGGEAAHVYGCVVGMLGALFGSESFTVYPYQLGHKNEEGLASGAWWFYQKLGFRPRDPGARALMERELARMARRPSHRSSRKTLQALAAHNVFWSRGAARDDVIGAFPATELSLAVTDLLSERFGSDRAAGEGVLADEAAARLGVARSWRRWRPDERTALRLWGPFLALLPEVDRWTAARRRQLVEVIRAKGGRRDAEAARRFDAHGPLRAAYRRLGKRLRRRGGQRR